MSSSTYPPVETPEELPTRFAEGWNDRDANKIAAIFEHDADFINVVGIWWDNREDIRKAHDYGLKVIFNRSDLKVAKTKVRHLSESVAVVHARMRLKGQTARTSSTEKPGIRFNVFTFVAQKSPDGWGCVAAQNTDIVPGKETNVIEEGEIKAADYRE